MYAYFLMNFTIPIAGCFKLATLPNKVAHREAEAHAESRQRFFTDYF
jgi:hypothetical protein